MIRKSFLLICLCLSQYSIAEQSNTTALPDPLSFQQALSYASDMNHPDLLQAESVLEQATSELSAARSATDFTADLILEAAYIEPSAIAYDQGNDDHLARLSINKQLYDFGQSDLKIDSAENDISAVKTHVKYLTRKRQISLARRFFDVILSDLKYAWDNEAMAIAYVRMDRARESHALEKISDVELMEMEDRYEEVRYQRYVSETAQRASRALLAEALNRPGDLPSNLTMPSLQLHKNELPEYEALLKSAMEQNQQLHLLRTQVESTSNRMQAARMQTRPTLNAELQVSEYSQEAGSNDKWRAALNLKIPLLENESMKAQISRYRSQWLKLRAMLAREENRVRHRVLELWQNIRLLNTRREQMLSKMDFRELALDKNRALYEMEVSTNLGDAMVAISEVRYRQAKTDFELTLAWMELKLLLGEETIYAEL